jgi:putative peptidoglycan lipid II flippase
MAASLAKSSGVFALMTLLSRILGFVRDTLQAVFFGASWMMDAYLVAFKIPNFMRRLFAEGAFSQAFVPVLSEQKSTQSHDDVRDFIGAVSGTFAAVLSVITALGVVGAPFLLALFAPGFGSDPAKQALGSELLRITFPYLMLISLTAFASGILNSYGQFGMAAFAPTWLNVCLILAMIGFAPNIHAQAWAVLVAGLMQLGFLLVPVWRLGLLARPRLAWNDARVRKVMVLMLPILLGSGIAQISLLLDTILASFLPTGSVSWLYYADRLMEFPLGLFSVAIGTVILPTLSGQHAKASGAAFSNTLNWGLKVLLLVGIPAFIGLIVLAEPLAATLFQYRKFTAHDTHMTAWALRAYAFAFLGFSLVKVLLPGYYARQDTKTPVRYGLIALSMGMAFNVGLVLLARYFQFIAPHAALAVGTSLNGCMNAFLLYRGLRRLGVYQPSPQWWTFLGQLLLASGLMTLALLALTDPASVWHQAGAVWKVSHLLGLVLAAAVIYFAVLALCGLRPRHLRA